MHCRERSSYCTVFQAEVVSIMTCARRGLEEGGPGERENPDTFRAARLCCFHGRYQLKKRSKLALECTHVLDRPTSRNVMLLRWDLGNADKLARAGSLSSLLATRPSTLPRDWLGMDN